MLFVVRCLASLCIFSFVAELTFAEDEERQPYPDSEDIERFVLDWSTHKRFAQGSDNFQLTWAEDGHLYGAWGDGGGFGGTNGRGRVGLGIPRIEGDADDYRGFNVWGGFEPDRPASFDGKSWGMIGVSGELFMWLVPDHPEGKSHRNHYEYVELVRSSDSGQGWLFRCSDSMGPLGDD
jgi:hypothetical protein|tara:strand:+ start:3814 stop:4350 length:537 start_codon:yes stop_codon:yes gene_type:complete